METSVIEFIKRELKALRRLKKSHPSDEKLIDGLTEDYEKKLMEERKKQKQITTHRSG